MSMLVFNPVFQVVMQEVPGEISIGFQIATCRQKCEGCSYKYLEKFGKRDLTLPEYEKILADNKGLATCVVFMGGEEEDDLPLFLERARSYGFKTCMYTGMKAIGDVDVRITSRLDYIKTGRWEGKSLRDPDTNQRFYSLPDGKDITAKFRTKKADQ